jgi:ISXO2 transposase-like protein
MAARVIPDVRKETLRDVVLENVELGAVVSTDDLMSYGLLTGDGYTHGAVTHAAKEWSWYDWRTGETFHTNSVEGFWRLFKASVRSNAHSRQREANARLPRRVLLSVESPAVRERDVRLADFAGLTAARIIASNALRSAAGKFAISCSATNSDNRSSRKARLSVNRSVGGIRPTEQVAVPAYSGHQVIIFLDAQHTDIAD